jgi:hypothetical protein
MAAPASGPPLAATPDRRVEVSTVTSSPPQAPITSATAAHKPLIVLMPSPGFESGVRVWGCPGFVLTGIAVF